MIFVTVGAQQPFDRLVHAVDQWAFQTGRNDVVAQIGYTRNPPAHINWVRMLDPVDYRQQFWQADLVISHAGAGTILTAMEMSKSLLVLPRRAQLGETRSDHQFATARAFSKQASLRIAEDEHELEQILSAKQSILRMTRIGSYASSQLLETVRSLVQTGEIQSPNLRYIPGPQQTEPPTVSEDGQTVRRKAA